MSRGLILFGAMGVGDTTLGRAVARRLGFPHFDLDDYLWRWDTAVPYTAWWPRDLRIERLTRDITPYPFFVMSGSMWSIRERFEPLFDLAVFLTAPAALCAERVRARSLARWGERVLPGGDMYAASAIYRDYLAHAQGYDTAPPDQFGRAQHEQWAAELPCPVLRLDGAKPISENTEQLIERYQRLRETTAAERTGEERHDQEGV